MENVMNKGWSMTRTLIPTGCKFYYYSQDY